MRGECFLFTTVPGVEDVVLDEIRRKFGDKLTEARIFGRSRMTGKVLACFQGVRPNELKGLRTVEHVIRVVGIAMIGRTKEELWKAISSFDLTPILTFYTSNTTVGVVADRVGEHEFKSVDAAILLGDRIREFLERLGLNVIFNLDNPDIIFRVIIDNDLLLVGISITRRSLRRRPYRKFEHPAAINPILASAMVYLLAPEKNARVLDVTCGSGTIAIEGALLREDLTFVCIDIDFGYVKGARENAINAGVYDRVDLVVMDSTRPALREGCARYAVFNPPFGIRIEPLEDLEVFYGELLKALRNVMRNGKIVFITIRRNIVRRVAGELGLRIINERTVDQGGVYSSIFEVEV